MPFNAQEFRASLGNVHPAPTNTFQAYFSGAPVILQGGEFDPLFRKVIFRTETVDLPSRQVETQERRYSGPQRLIPYGLLYPTLQVQFIEDKDYSMRNIFDNWQDKIFSGRDYVVRYYDDVIAPEFIIECFDTKGTMTKRYKFKEVFPIAVSPQQMSWAEKDNYVRVAVELAYHEFTEE